MGVPLANVMFIGLSAQLESKIQIPMVIYQVSWSSVASEMTLFFDTDAGITNCDRESPHNGFSKMD